MKYLFSILAVCLFLSCTENRNEINQTSLKIPDNLKIFKETNHTNISKELKSNSLLIFTSINTSCATCLLDFKKWREFQDILKKNKVGLVPICHSKDNFELLKYLFESGELESLDFPIFLDINNEFLDLNDNLLDGNKNLTVLTNSKKEVILHGNPFQNQNLMNKYLKMIKN